MTRTVRSRRWMLGFGTTAVLAGLGSTQVWAQTRPADEAPTVPAALELAPVHGARPSVSDDGRWVVYAGLPTDGSDRTSTVYLRDELDPAAAPIELTKPGEGFKIGDSVNPVISGDGCVVVTTTQMAFDLFRDDDLDDRWDVYREILPHCEGGSFDDWDLLSTSIDPEAESAALDRVSPTDPAAVSETGAVIAFTHQARAGDDPLLAVSVVDLTVPVGEFARIGTVLGTPPVAPNTTFRYVGQHEPAMSSDGRVVAFTSDALSDQVADDVTPVWGSGPVPGGFATSQVYVLDRQAANPSTAVRLVSAAFSQVAASSDTSLDEELPTGVPADTGADSPSVSGNGQYVVYRSNASNLAGDVELPTCVEACPTQIYRFDQSSSTTVLVSRQGRADDSKPSVAANLGASQASITDDGSQVAFVTRATNLFPTAAATGNEPDDGEVVVSAVDLGEISRASLQADGLTPAPATNNHPVLSATGQRIVFDTLSSPLITGGTDAGRQVVSLERTPTLVMADVDMGTIAVGYPGDEWYAVVHNLGPSTFTPSTITSSSPEFALTDKTFVTQVPDSWPCDLGKPVPPGGTCTVTAILTPAVAGALSSTLTVSEAGTDGAVVSASLWGAGGEPALAPDPAGHAYRDTVVGGDTSTFSFDIANVGFALADISAITIDGANPDDFDVTGSSCLGLPLNIGASCAVDVIFRPTDAGYRTATVQVWTTLGQYTSVILTGNGGYQPQFLAAADTVTAGDPLGLAGEGFRPNSDVTISWSDGRGESVVVTTGKDGAFMVAFPTRRTERAGSRQLVAQTADGLITVDVTVANNARRTGNDQDG